MRLMNIELIQVLREAHRASRGFGSLEVEPVKMAFDDITFIDEEATTLAGEMTFSLILGTPKQEAGGKIHAGTEKGDRRRRRN